MINNTKIKIIGLTFSVKSQKKLRTPIGRVNYQKSFDYFHLQHIQGILLRSKGGKFDNNCYKTLRIIFLKYFTMLTRSLYTASCLCSFNNPRMNISLSYNV